MKKDANLEILQSFSSSNLPDLDLVVLGALELFRNAKLPKIEENGSTRPLIVGSGNAEITGRIVFRNYDAVFASESSFEEKLKSVAAIDRVIVISASGQKHAPRVIEKAKEYNKPITLLTNRRGSIAEELLRTDAKDKVILFPRNREPYTYNASTYLGMILSSTGEDAGMIYDFLNTSVSRLSFDRFAHYDKFFLIVPSKFYEISRMLDIKFMELFGRKISRDVMSSELVSHGTTVVPGGELFISFGEENHVWGEKENRMFVPLPATGDYGAMMAIGYYIIGQIQKKQPAHYKENINAYVEKSSHVFGHKIDVIVE